MKYSDIIELLLVVVWAAGSLLLAWFVRRRFQAYIYSVVLSVPMIGYSMAVDGPLEMGGIVHVLCCGVYVLPFHYFFQRYRLHRQQRIQQPGQL